VGNWARRLETVRRVGIVQVILARGWIFLGGDQRMQKSLRLGKASWVLDVGAYQGDFTAEMRRRGARATAVEPIPAFADELRRRFANDPGVTIIEAALGGEDGVTGISLSADGSSAWVDSDETLEVALMDVDQVLGDQEVQLMKINAEGAEFDILERLLQAGRIAQVEVLLVQFHRFAPDAAIRRKCLRKMLKRTHSCQVNVPWVWEKWTLRERLT
jgi:FkbM family methyltransferase